MANPIKRLNYFDHQFLRAQDFNDEQGYHVGMRRQHNRLFHSWGIASGMVVTYTAGTSVASVSAGMALDSAGNEIVLVDAASTPDVSSMKGQTVFVTVTYIEQPSDPSSDAGASGNTRITETGKIEVVTTPANPSLNLVLARLTIDAGGKIASSDNGVDPNSRRIAGASGADIVAHSLTLTDANNTVTTWPKLSVSALSTTSLTGNLAVGGNLSGGNLSCQSVNAVGSISLMGGVTSGGPISCGGNFGVSGTATIDGGAAFYGNVEISGSLKVDSNPGITHGRLSMAGGQGPGGTTGSWSSFSFNATHNAPNNNWVFTDPTRACATIEMDDSSGHSRFEVYTTTLTAKTAWALRFAINGDTGDISLCPSGGNVTFHGAAVTLSDGRLKSSVEPIEDPLAKIAAIRGVTYNLTARPERGREIGVIAQEVEQVLPELVVTSEKDGMKGVDYGKLTAVLIEAIKQLKQQVDELKSAMPKSKSMMQS